MAAASGGLLALGYPGTGWWVLAFVAYVPLLFALWDVERPKSGFLLGWTTGTVLHGISFAWLQFTMEEMSGLPTAVGWLVVALHAAAMGLHQAALGWVLVWSREWQAKAWWPAWVGAALMAAELVVPWQFPWYLGNMVYLAPTWLQAADLVGVVGVSGLLMATNVLVARVLRERSWRPAAVACVLLAAWFGYGAARLAQVEGTPVQKVWRVGIVQHNPSLKEKKSLKPKPRLPMLRRAGTLTRQLPLAELDAVVWSEGTLPFFYVPTELKTPGRAPPILRRVTRDVQALAREIRIPLVFGTLRRLDPQWTQRARNAAVILHEGQQQAYDKQLLVPFGEFLPGRDLIPSLKDAIPGVSDLGAGEGTGVRTVAGVKLGLSICYEALFMGFMWEHTAPADLLVNLTDDVWFGPTNAPELHLMVQIPRAVELRRPLLRATATGVSGLVDAGGRLHGRTPVYAQATRVVKAELRDLGSPFRLWGPWPARAVALGVVLGCVALWRRRRHAAA